MSLEKNTVKDWTAIFQLQCFSTFLFSNAIASLFYICNYDSNNGWEYKIDGHCRAQKPMTRLTVSCDPLVLLKLLTFTIRV